MICEVGPPSIGWWENFYFINACLFL